MAVVNAGAPASGGITIPSAATIAISGENTSQWTSQLWQIYDYPLGFAAPSGWSTDANGVIFSTAVTPAAFTLPANTVRWGKMMLRLTVNGGLANGLPSASLIDESTALSMLSPNNLRDLAFNETIQFGGPRSQWAAELRAILRTIDGNFGLYQNNLNADGTGFAQVNAPVHSSSNPKADRKEYDVNFVTPTTSATTIFTLPLVLNHLYSIRGVIAVLNSPVSAFSEWDVVASARNSSTGPIVEITNATPVTLRAPATTTFTLAAAISGSNFVLNATDPVGGRRWAGPIEVIDRTF